MSGTGPIESYLSRLAAALPEALREAVLAEAEDHLRLAAEAYRATGLDELEAEDQAVADFGPVDVVAAAHRGGLAEVVELRAVKEGDEMFERFTDRARATIVKAQEEARGLGHNYIGTEHLLLGLLVEAEGLAAKSLASLGVTMERARQEITQMIGAGAPEPGPRNIPFTPRSKKVLEMALREALHLEHNYIGTEHILLGLVREGEGVAVQALHRFGLTSETVGMSVMSLMGGVSYEVTEEVRVLERLADGWTHAQIAEELKKDEDGVRSIIGRILKSRFPVRLTSREQQVLKGLTAGLSREFIGEKLGISSAAFTNHILNIIEKRTRPSRRVRRTPGEPIPAGREFEVFEEGFQMMSDAVKAMAERLQHLEERIARLEPPAQEAEEA